MSTLPPIADEHVDGLEMSQSLKIFFYMNRLKTLSELLRRPMSEWFGFTGFSQHLLYDLLGFLEKNTMQTFIIE
ncbi:MAG TPA: hypothetical protein VK772_00635 [Puia sp.]|nr:hypothetical protein [Puia sp.]